MTTQAAIPLKWYVPFATGDASRVEIPVTSSDATRASQTLGFPPLTMQPPAVGGVPPQGEDFNGAMNQVARVAWWVLNGGGWPFDATFATNSNIGGYPNGAVLQSADFLGQWISTADNNQNNPDTVGTNWVPGFQYGASALTGQTGGTVTLTPLQAAKRGLTISGALTSALVVVFPTWVKDWSITNNTTGAFTVIAKTLAGSGVTIPQNGSPTPVSGDGTNINQSPQNVAAGTSSTHAAQFSQTVGRLLNVQTFTANGTYTATAGTTKVIVEAQAAGGGSGGAPVQAAGSGGLSGSGGGGGYAKVLITSGFNGAAVTVGAAGAAGAAGANAGGAGGTASFGTFVSCPGGGGGVAGGSGTAISFVPGGVPQGLPTIAGATTIVSAGGGVGATGCASAAGGLGVAGAGGSAILGSGGSGASSGSGQVGNGYGSGGGGTYVTSGGVAAAGRAGAGAIVIVYEYA